MPVEATPRSWSCSTLMTGMEHVRGQSKFLKSQTDEQLEEELAVPEKLFDFFLRIPDRGNYLSYRAFNFQHPYFQHNGPHFQAGIYHDLSCKVDSNSMDYLFGGCVFSMFICHLPPHVHWGTWGWAGRGSDREGFRQWWAKPAVGDGIFLWEVHPGCMSPGFSAPSTRH